LIYNLKLKIFILITLVDFAELLTDFSYTNFTVGLSNVDAVDRLRVYWNIILLCKGVSIGVSRLRSLTFSLQYILP